MKMELMTEDAFAFNKVIKYIYASLEFKNASFSHSNTLTFRHFYADCWWCIYDSIIISTFMILLALTLQLCEAYWQNGDDTSLALVNILWKHLQYSILYRLNAKGCWVWVSALPTQCNAVLHAGDHQMRDERDHHTQHSRSNNKHLLFYDCNVCIVMYKRKTMILLF